MSQPGRAGPGTRDATMGGLYPFLGEPPPDPEGVLAAVRQSIVDKAREIAELREQVGHDQGPRLSACAAAVARAFQAGGRLLAFGNGGSACDAQAVAQLFLHPTAGRALPALALPNDLAAGTALANDVGVALVFARQLAALASPGDVALGLSTSGNSENVLRGLEEAARRGLVTVGFAGYQGGRMAEAPFIGHLFVVPSASVHRIQEAQTTLYQVLWELVQEALDEDASGGRSR